MSSAPHTTTSANATDPAARRRQRFALALLWIVPLAWSANYLIARAAAGVIAPHTLALGRWSLAFALMLPLAWRGLSRDGAPWLRAEWRQLLVLGGLGMWICGAFVYIGGQTTSSANIALIYAATPIAVAVVGAVLLGERMATPQIAGVALALAGVLFVIAKGDPRNLLAVRFTVGDGWVLAAGLSWTAYSVLLRQWPSRLGTAERLVAITAGGILVLLPFTALEWALVEQRAVAGALRRVDAAQRVRVATQMLGRISAAPAPWYQAGGSPSSHQALKAAYTGPR